MSQTENQNISQIPAQPSLPVEPQMPTQTQMPSQPVVGNVWIAQKAAELRDKNPQKYGVKYTKRGQLGYVAGGWELAKNDAKELFYQAYPEKKEKYDKRTQKMRERNTPEYIARKDEERRQKAEIEELQKKFPHLKICNRGKSSMMIVPNPVGVTQSVA